MERARSLGCYDHFTIETNTHPKPVPYRRIDHNLFVHNIEQHDISEILNGSDIDTTVENLSKLIHECAENSKTKPPALYSNDAKVEDRWQRILKANDSRSLWQGIDWNGKYRETKTTERPPEEAFRVHMERLLNPSDNEPIDPTLANTTEITIPLQAIVTLAHHEQYIPHRYVPCVVGDLETYYDLQERCCHGLWELQRHK